MPSKRSAKLDPAQLKIQKILDWADNPTLFFQEALKIRTKSDGLQPLILRPIQEQYLNSKTKRTKTTKPRQVGLTTVALAELYHRCLFTPYTRVALATQHGATAQEVFAMILLFQEQLPSWFKRIPLFKAHRTSVNSIAWGNKSAVKAGTANTQFWRGQTFQAAHLTECAYYDDLPEVLSSLAHAVSDEGSISLETTANGHDQWYDFYKDGDNGYLPLFFSWLDDPTYVADPSQLPLILLPHELDYIEQYALPQERQAWFVKTLREKCGSDLRRFNSEVPINPAVAFQESGHRYFPLFYQTASSTPIPTGLTILRQPDQNHKYVVGVDPAEGKPDGDYTAITVIDQTNLTIVATYADRIAIPSAVEVVKMISNKFNGAQVICERNNHGHAVILGLQKASVPLWVASKVSQGKLIRDPDPGILMTSKSRSEVLAKLLKYVAEQKLVISCPRIQAQANSFIYSEQGKPEAQKNGHDDLIFSTAHALHACSEHGEWKPPTKHETPRNAGERVAWELKHGKLWTGHYTEEF